MIAFPTSNSYMYLLRNRFIIFLFELAWFTSKMISLYHLQTLHTGWQCPSSTAPSEQTRICKLTSFLSSAVTLLRKRHTLSPRLSCRVDTCDKEDNAPQSELDHLLLGEMCIQAGKGVELQCKREYWDVDPDAASCMSNSSPYTDIRPKNKQTCRQTTWMWRVNWPSLVISFRVSQTLKQDGQGKEDQRWPYANRQTSQWSWAVNRCALSSRT